MSAQGLLMDVKRFAVHDGPGIRTTLFLKGCSLKCIWCHNPEGIPAKPQLAYYEHKCICCGECVKVCPVQAHSVGQIGHVFDRTKCIGCGKCEQVCLGEALKHYGRKVSVEEAVQIAMEDADFYGTEGGVTISGGEPLLQVDFVVEFLSAMKKKGIHTAVDTCGNVPQEAYESILPYTDMFLYDIKHITPDGHRKLTGKTNERILSNIRFLADHETRIEVRIPLVPGCNDDLETLNGMAAFLAELRIERVKILPYHSLARSKYRALGMEDTMPDVESPSDERLHEVAELFKAKGVNAVSGRD